MLGLTKKLSERLTGLLKEFFNERFWLSPNEGSVLNRCWISLFVLSFFYWLYEIIMAGGPLSTPDSAGYVQSWAVLSTGKVDLVRTPGYPMLIGLFTACFGKAGLILLMLLQELCFLVSVILFRQMCSMMIASRRIGILLTCIYLLLPVVMLYHDACFLNTESLTFSAIVLMLWVTIKGERCPSAAKGVIICLDALICIAIRPIYIYLIPCYILLWSCLLLFKGKSFRRYSVAGIAGMVLVSGIVVGYRRFVYDEYGYDGITSVSYCNNYFFVREYDLLKPEFIDNAELRLCMDSILQSPVGDMSETWREIRRLNRHDVNYRNMNEAVNRSILADPKRSLSALLSRADKVGGYPMLQYSPERTLSRIYAIFVPRLSLVYLFLVIDLFVLLWIWKRSHNFPVMSAFLWMFVVVTNITAVAGAQNEWGRLTYQAFPALLLLIGKWSYKNRVCR